MKPAAGQPTATLVLDKLAQSILVDLRTVAVHADRALRILCHTAGQEEHLALATFHLLPASAEGSGEEPGGPLLTDLFPELIGLEGELAAVAAGHSPRFELPLINRIQPGSGDRLYLSLTALPHPEAADQLVLLVQDTTAQGRLQQQVVQQLNELRLVRAELEAANKKLSRLNDEKSAFLQMAAHDLRAPLVVIRGYVEMVLEDAGAALDASATAGLQTVLSRTRQMAQLVDNLLDVEMIEGGMITLLREPVDLVLLVEQVASSFLPAAREKGLTLCSEVPAGMPQPLADWQRLLQVLNNLVGNAVKFTPSGGLIKIEVKRHHGDVAIEVSDNGPGLSEADQARLFQRFFRTDQARKMRIPGTGLGLSIVRAIVEQHGGHAFVRSQVGKGSVFGFTLPTGEQ